MSLWGQLNSLAQQALEKANELAEEVGVDAAAAAESLVGAAGCCPNWVLLGSSHLA